MSGLRVAAQHLPALNDFGFLELQNGPNFLQFVESLKSWDINNTDETVKKNIEKVFDYFRSNRAQHIKKREQIILECNKLRKQILTLIDTHKGCDALLAVQKELLDGISLSLDEASVQKAQDKQTIAQLECQNHEFQKLHEKEKVTNNSLAQCNKELEKSYHMKRQQLKDLKIVESDNDKHSQQMIIEKKRMKKKMKMAKQEVENMTEEFVMIQRQLWLKEAEILELRGSAATIGSSANASNEDVGDETSSSESTNNRNPKRSYVPEIIENSVSKICKY